MYKRHKIERSNVVIPIIEESVVLDAMTKRLFVEGEEGTKVYCMECKQSYHKRYDNSGQGMYSNNRYVI